MAYLRKNVITRGGPRQRLTFMGNIPNAHRPDMAIDFVTEEKIRRTADASKRAKLAAHPIVSRGPVVRPSLLEELLKKVEDSSKGGATGTLRPYIILPRSSGCLLNLLNGREFLENSRFKPPEGDVFKAAEFEVSSKVNGRELVFRVTDDVSTFQKIDWLQTVAVFIDGSKWQFNQWPFRDLADLFATIKGFYLSYDNTATPRYTNTLTGEMWSAAQKDMVGHVVVDPYPVVKYTVKRSTISRHVDGLVAYQFWKEIEAFLMQPRMAKFNNDYKINGAS